MAEQAYAYVTLIPVAKGFQRAIAKELGLRVSAKPLEKKLAQVSQVASKEALAMWLKLPQLPLVLPPPHLVEF